MLLFFTHKSQFISVSTSHSSEPVLGRDLSLIGIMQRDSPKLSQFSTPYLFQFSKHTYHSSYSFAFVDLVLVSSRGLRPYCV